MFFNFQLVRVSIGEWRVNTFRIGCCLPATNDTTTVEELTRHRMVHSQKDPIIRLILAAFIAYCHAIVRSCNRTTKRLG